MVLLLAEVSDTAQIAIVVGSVCAGLYAVIDLAIKTYGTIKLAQIDASSKANAVAMAENTKVTKETKEIINGGAGYLLKENAEGQEFRAKITEQPKDIARAELAREASDRHVEVAEQIKKQSENTLLSPPGKT